MNAEYRTGYERSKFLTKPVRLYMSEWSRVKW